MATFLLKKTHAFFSRKKYFSSDRESEINFENVLELFARGVNTSTGQPLLVTIFECKSYSHRVDVSEVEEFDSKLGQLKGFRAKGFMETTKGYKSGAISFAKSRGIGLIRFVPDNQIEILLYHMTPLHLEEIKNGFAKRANRGLTDPHYVLVTKPSLRMTTAMSSQVLSQQ